MTNKTPTFAGSGERNVMKLAQQLKGYFSPKIIGEVNDVYVKVTKIKGDEVPWHAHDGEDEMFYILNGRMKMFIDGEEPFDLKEGDFYIVKQGVKHRVTSQHDCWMILVENKSTKHVGDVDSPIAKSIEQQF